MDDYGKDFKGNIKIESVPTLPAFVSEAEDKRRLIYAEDEEKVYYGGTAAYKEAGGTSGTSGVAGTSGTSGAAGTSGTSGDSGTSGSSGNSGTSGTSGVAGTSGTSGVVGTSGTSGVAGTSGTSGTSGVAGTSGTSGVAGTSGSSGNTGTSGTSGSSGVAGTSGTSGTSGVAGTSGTSGVAGTSGTSGSSGNTGTSGTSGVAGTSGTSGVAGTSGTSGSSGVAGTSGTSGVAGTSGTSGSSGAAGTSGTSGSSGAAGTSGTSGVAGTSGTSGSSGAAGTSGTSGSFASAAEVLAGTEAAKAIAPDTLLAARSADASFWGIKNLRLIDVHAGDATRVIVNPNAMSIALDVGSHYHIMTAAVDVDSVDDLDTGALAAGTDYYIYACTDGTTLSFKVSANSTNPTGFDASHSRKIGGFHTLCVAVGAIGGHTLTNYAVKDILPASIWDLKHRTRNLVNAGMVYSSELQVWVDIYISSGSAGASVYNAEVHDTHSLMDHFDFGKAGNKRLPNDPEFQIFAFGTP
jgi:hypothetical protein